MDALRKLLLVVHPQPEGGYTVTSPLLTELVTEGGTVQEAIANLHDALAATIELYEDMGRPLPEAIREPGRSGRGSSPATEGCSSGGRCRGLGLGRSSRHVDPHPCQRLGPGDHCTPCHRREFGGLRM
jgi:antitoxin HicB